LKLGKHAAVIPRNSSTHVKFDIENPTAKTSGALTHSRTKTAFPMDTAEAVIPIAIKIPTSDFSVSGLRSWCKKVNGKMERTTSVTMLMAEIVLDTIRNVFLLTHFAPWMVVSHVAVNGIHCKKSNRRDAADVTIVTPIRMYRNILHEAFC
jgi:hypothetical protein